MIDITMDWKDAFFDRPKIETAVDKQTRRAITRSLAFVRKKQRSSLRRRKKVSERGSPPSVHSQSQVATLKNILFAYDQRTKSGVVGMVKLNQREQDWISMGSTTVPQIHEFGGAVAIHEVATQKQLARLGDKAWRRRDKRRSARSGDVRRVRRAVYPPRPSAGPALEYEANAGNILSPWANVVGG